MNRKSREKYKEIIDIVRRQIIRETIRKVFNSSDEIIDWVIEVVQMLY